MWFVLSLYFALWTSISTSIVKHLTGKVTNPISILFIGNVFILFFIFVLLKLLIGFPHLTQKFFVLMLASAMMDTLAAILAFWAVKLSPISLISPISSFNPLFTTLIAFIFLKEELSLIKILGVITIVIGAYLLNISEIKNGLTAPFKRLMTNRGVQFFFLANFIWGITPIFQKQAILQTTPNNPLFVSFFGNLIVTFVISFLIIKSLKPVLSFAKTNLKWFLIIGIFASISQWAAMTAFSLTNLGMVTAIFKLSALFTIVIGGVFFKETKIKERFLGASVMVLGTILLVV